MSINNVIFGGQTKLRPARPLVKYDVDSHKLCQFIVGFIVYMTTYNQCGVWMFAAQQLQVTCLVLEAWRGIQF